MDAQPVAKGHDADHRDDEPIVAALRRGDERAFQALVERYHLSLVRLAQTYVRDPDVAEDVAQEAWLGFIQSLPRFAGRSSLKTWLFRILVNCAHAKARRETRSVPFSALESGTGDGDPLIPEERFLPAGSPWEGHWADPPQSWPEERLLEDEVAHLIDDAVRRLPAHQQAVLSLRDVEGWSAAEVCDVLAISEGNQRVMLHRARTSVRVSSV